MKHFRIVAIHEKDAFYDNQEMIGDIVTMTESPATLDLVGGAYDAPSHTGGAGWRACSVQNSNGREIFFAAVKLEEVLPS